MNIPEEHKVLGLQQRKSSRTQFFAVFYQIQMLLGSSEMLAPQSLGNQLHDTVTPSCSPLSNLLTI